jgi:ribosome-associated protein
MAEKRTSTTGRPSKKKAASRASQPAAKQPTAKRAAAKRPTVKSSKTVARTKAPAKKAPVRSTKAKIAAPPKIDSLVKVVEAALDEMKAVQIKVLDVRKLTDITDTLVIASGNSDRHVRSIAERVVEHAKKAGFRPMGVEGQRDGEWVLVDLQDVIVHIMLPRVRELYRLESLWDVSAARRDAVANG